MSFRSGYRTIDSRDDISLVKERLHIEYAMHLLRAGDVESSRKYARYITDSSATLLMVSECTMSVCKRRRGPYYP